MKRKIKFTTLSIRVRRNVNEALKFIKSTYCGYCVVLIDLKYADIWVDTFF